MMARPLNQGLKQEFLDAGFETEELSGNILKAIKLVHQIVTISSSPMVIFGFSVAGIAAAMRLSAAGRSVELYEIDGDLTLRDQFVVSSSGMGKDLLGTDFETVAEGLLRKAGVLVHGDAKLARFIGEGSSIQCELRVKATHDKRRNLNNCGVVYAPNGTPSSPW